MIRTLRRAHRRIAVAIALLLPFALLLALRERRPWHPLADLPGPVRDDDDDQALLSAQRTPTGASFRAVRDGDELVAALADDRAPFVLAYWTRTSGPVDELPADAVLLGRVERRARRLRVPPGEGQLVLYSLGHGSVVGHGTPETH